MAKEQVKYLVFDIETIADGDLVSRIKYPGDNLSPVEAVERYSQERLEQYGTEFIPHTYHLPISVVVGKVNKDFELFDMVALDVPEFRPHVITEHFWRGWKQYDYPTFVTFNGRTFDLPVMELAAFRYGISVPDWFNLMGKSWEQRRNRYNIDSHMDLQDTLTNFGATRFAGGLDLVATMLGKPGKMEVAGHMVQDLYNEGQLTRINDYCRCDVLDTYFIFLRTAVLMGKLKIGDEQQLIEKTRQWLEQQQTELPVYGDYLSCWGDWKNPWDDEKTLFD